MNATQAENLRILIRHMETKVTRELNMITINYPCGTPACAMGHARTVPGLSAQCGGGLISDAARVFGLDHDRSKPSRDWGRLFGGALVVMERTWWGWGPLRTKSRLYMPTPQEWAAEARKVLAENGYSMDDAADAFIERIKKIAREPIPLTPEELDQVRGA